MPTNKTTFDSYEDVYTKKYKDNDIHNSVVIIHSNNMVQCKKYSLFKNISQCRNNNEMIQS